MKMKKSFIIALVLGILSPFIITFQAFSGPYPEKPIEFVVHQAPGGGSDIYTRAIVDMLGREKIVTVPMPILNKGGGSGAVAVEYVAQRKGDPYSIFATTTTVYAAMIRRNVSLDEFTPLCRLIIDPNIFIVKGDSHYKDVREVITAAKKARKSVKLGMGSIGGTDHQLGYILGKATGVEFNMIHFKTGGEAFTALLGGHVDFVFSNPSETAGQVEAGKLRVLATFTEKRLPFLPNVPTMKEQGFNAGLTLARGFFLTKGVSPEVVKYFEVAFDKLRKTPSWEKYLKDEMVLDGYLSPIEFKKWLEKEMDLYNDTLRGLGLLK